VVQFVEDFTDTVSIIVAGQSDIVDEVEDRILKNRFLRESGDLGSVRRLVTRLRRHLGAQRSALAHQAHLAPAWWNEEDAGALRRAIERLSLALESIQERARLLQEELGSRTFETTNRNLSIVSLFSAVFLPLTLITGIFGMNVGPCPALRTGAVSCGSRGLWSSRSLLPLSFFTGGDFSRDRRCEALLGWERRRVPIA
jgi:zinc transporter